MWIARDKGGLIWIYKSKPIKFLDLGIWNSQDLSVLFDEVFPDLFSEVMWEDEEPTEIKLVKDK